MKSTFSIAAVISCLCILAAGALSYDQRVPSALQIVDFEGKGITLRHEDLRPKDISRRMRMERYDDVLFVPGNNESLAKLAALDYSPEDYDGLIVQAGKDSKDSEYTFPCRGKNRLLLAWRDAGTSNQRSCNKGVAVSPSKDSLALWQKPDSIAIFQPEKQFLKETSPRQVVIVPDRALTLVKTANSETGIFVYVGFGNVTIKSAKHPRGRQVKSGERYAYPEDKITPIDRYQFLTSPEIQDFLNSNNWLLPNLPDRVSRGIAAQLAQQQAALNIAIASIRQSRTVCFNSLKLDPSRIIGGSTARGVVELSEPAPAGGAVVKLASDNSQIAKVPSTVTVPTGKTSTFFEIYTAQVSSPQQVEISASCADINRETILAVEPRYPTNIEIHGQPNNGIPEEEIIGAIQWLFTAGYHRPCHFIRNPDNLSNSSYWDEVRYGIQQDEPVFIYRYGNRLQSAPEGYYWSPIDEHPSTRIYRLQIRSE